MPRQIQNDLFPEPPGKKSTFLELLEVDALADAGALHLCRAFTAGSAPRQQRLDLHKADVILADLVRPAEHPIGADRDDGLLDRSSVVDGLDVRNLLAGQL